MRDVFGDGVPFETFGAAFGFAEDLAPRRRYGNICMDITSRNGDAVTLIYGPSPALKKLIENGADRDIFSACNPAIGTAADVADARSKSSTARSTQPTSTGKMEET